MDYGKEVNLEIIKGDENLLKQLKDEGVVKENNKTIVYLPKNGKEVYYWSCLSLTEVIFSNDVDIYFILEKRNCKKEIVYDYESRKKIIFSKHNLKNDVVLFGFNIPLCSWRRICFVDVIYKDNKNIKILFYKSRFSLPPDYEAGFSFTGEKIILYRIKLFEGKITEVPKNIKKIFKLNTKIKLERGAKNE